MSKLCTSFRIFFPLNPWKCSYFFDLPQMNGHRGPRSSAVIKSILLFLFVFWLLMSQWINKKAFCKVNASVRYIKQERHVSSLLTNETWRREGRQRMNEQMSGVNAKHISWFALFACFTITIWLKYCYYLFSLWQRWLAVSHNKTFFIEVKS